MKSDEHFTRFSHALPETLNGLHEVLHDSHETLNGLLETFLARNLQLFGVVVCFRVCKFCQRATVLNFHIHAVLKKFERFKYRSYLREKVKCLVGGFEKKKDKRENLCKSEHLNFTPDGAVS